MAVKPDRNKQQIRTEMAAQIEAYLNRGGEVQQLAQGASGRDPGQALIAQSFDQPRAGRTPVNEAIEAVAARREAGRKPSAKTHKPKRPEKQVMLDDFGEPLRWQWKE